jgi:hypothetical protein
MGYRNKDVSVRHRHRIKRQQKVRCQHKKCEHKKRKQRREVAQVRHVRKCVRAFSECNGLPFQDFLSIEVIQEMMEEVGLEFRDRIYTPYVALWAFLSQVINKEKSCSDAVSRVNQDQAQRGERLSSTNTSAYCDARKRLPEELILGLVRQTGMGLAREAEQKWLWMDRHVFLIDGSTVDMADTEANQKAYPQSSTQKKGLGFPSARIAALFSLAVGTVVDCQIGPIKGKKTGENELFREMFDTLQRGDIVLGDCLYDSYRDIADLLARGVDTLFGMKQSRHCDFRRGEKLGDGDHIVIWTKPKFDADRMDRETWEKLPDTLRMRELKIVVNVQGKIRVIRVVTTLLDSSVYSKEAVLQLFRQRWNVELDLRCLKTVLGMDHLACKTPSMVRKEFYIYLLAYNLIRIRMAQAAALHNKKPREISFTGARTAMAIWMPLIAQEPPGPKREKMERHMLDMIASRTVGTRSGRWAPRKRKRRPSPKYPYLTKPRNQERQRVAA